jgi:hypothetical protein
MEKQLKESLMDMTFKYKINKMSMPIQTESQYIYSGDPNSAVAWYLKGPIQSRAGI